MQKLVLPHIKLPREFVDLLTMNLSGVTSAAPIFDVLHPNPALIKLLERAFAEFDDGRGLQKTMMALGWPNFRDRVASLYIYKAVHGKFPRHTSMDVIEEARKIESRFSAHGVHGVSRTFLLGFYLTLANLNLKKRENNSSLEIRIPENVNTLLRLSQGRSEKTDWLILVGMHLLDLLGEKIVLNGVAGGRRLEDFYHMMSTEQRRMMFENLLSYGASIGESDLFLYEKV